MPGGAFSPPHSHRQGGAEGRQRRALRSLSCSAGRDQGRGAYLFRAALQSPFAHRDGLARTPRAKGGGNRAPPLSVRGAPRGCAQAGATRKEGVGDANTQFASPTPFVHLLMLHGEGGAGGTDSGCRGRKGVVTSSHESQRRITQGAENVTWCHVTCVGVGELGQLNERLDPRPVGVYQKRPRLGSDNVVTMMIGVNSMIALGA